MYSDKCEFCPLKNVHDKQCPARFIPNPIFCERSDPSSPIYHESVKGSIMSLIEKFPESANVSNLLRHETLIQESFSFRPRGIPIFIANQKLYDEYQELEGYHKYLVLEDCENNDERISRHLLTEEVLSQNGSIVFFLGFSDDDLWLLNKLKTFSTMNYQIDSELPGFDGAITKPESLEKTVTEIVRGNYTKDKKIISVTLSRIDLKIVQVMEKLSEKYLLKMISFVASDTDEFDSRLAEITSVVYGIRNKTHEANKFCDIIITDVLGYPRYYDNQILINLDSLLKKDDPLCYIETTIQENKLGIFQKAKNFGNALKEHIVDGLSRAEDAVIKNRLDICSGCNKNDNGSCEACGCILSEKVTWATSECPLGKWAAQKSELTQYQGGCGCGKS